MEESGKIVSIYQRYGKAWDGERSRSLFEKSWLDRFLAALPAPRHVLDLGCGGGEPLAAYLIEQGCRVTGIDSSPVLIDLCRERFPEQAWRVSDMRETNLGVAFDGILAWDSFFHLTADDQRAMFPRFARHTHEGAVLMFTSGSVAGEAIGRYKDQPLFHASLDSDEYRTLLHEHGFSVRAHTVDDPDCGGHTIWLARRD